MAGKCDPHKQMYQDARRALKQELRGEAHYELPPAQRRALDAELDVIMTLIRKGLPEETKTPAEKKVVASLRGTGGDVIREMLDLHATKRILNIGTNLSIRIFGSPKLPTKQKMMEFLQPYGVIKLKKSDRTKMLVATLTDYKQYDRVLELGSIMLDNISVNIKPFQVDKRIPIRKNAAGQKARVPSTNAAANGRPSLNEAIVLDEVHGSEEDIRLDDLEDY